MDRANRRARRPKAPEPRQVAGIGAGALLATLVAAEAAARAEPPPPGDDAPEDGPLASSLADILDLSEICATRGSFGAIASRHDHDYFRPRFLHATGRHDDHDQGAIRDDRHDGAHADSASHGGGHAAGATAVSSSAHGGLHAEGAPVAPTGHGHLDSSDPAAAAALHAHDVASDVLFGHAHDLDAGLDALLAAAHSGHDGAALPDRGADALQQEPAESVAPPAQVDAGHAAPADAAAQSLASLIDPHQHADAVIVTAEI